MLRNGCRYVEIDVWNGPSPYRALSSPNIGHKRQESQSISEQNQRVEPLVHHLGTMTSAVQFREVCQAIRESAFENNRLPIIVDLNVGADKEQQEAIVDIMKEEWGSLLLDKPFDHCDPTERQPRLEELYNRILIKTKRSDENLGISKANRGQGVSFTPIINSKPPICQALADLAIYTYGEHYVDDNSLGNCKAPGHIFSMSKNSILLLRAKAKLDKVITHNRDFFMHIHPNELRIASINPDPSVCWRLGVQMVAMNWQNTDDQMTLNHAMFAGTNGWVLKPRSLLGGGPATTTTTTGEASSSPPPNLALQNVAGLDITVLAGQSLPRPGGGGGGIRRMTNRFGITIGRSFRPKVRVEVLVARQATTEVWSIIKETVTARSENPDWGREAEMIKFRDLTGVMQELSFVW